MNNYYDFMDINTDYVIDDNFYPQNFEVQEQLAEQMKAFPQNVQNSIGLNDFNNIMNNSVQNNCGLQNLEEGFSKGNMFPKLFDPYKNWMGNRIVPTSEKESMLNKIQMLDFAMKDINLYLDVHPNDNCMINKFNEYLKQKNDLLKDYEAKYGPITLTIPSVSLEGAPWAWTEVKSPWERGA